MKILQTNRLILRTWQNSDLEPMAQINQDPRVMEYFPGLQDVARTKRFIHKAKQDYEKYGYTFYATELIKNHEFIGFVGLSNVNFRAHFTPATEIGWRLNSNHWNKGYATEAAKAVLHHAFTTLCLDKVVSFTVATNMPSRHIMEKIGLHHNTKDDFDHPALEPSSPLCRHALYRLTKNDYLKDVT